MVTGNPDSSREATSHLEAQERAKAARYQSTPTGPLPSGLLCCPLVHISRDLFLASAAFWLLHRISHSIARLSAPSDPHSWGHHLATTFQLNCERLAHTLCLHDWRMHKACASLL